MSFSLMMNHETSTHVTHTLFIHTHFTPIYFTYTVRRHNYEPHSFQRDIVDKRVSQMYGLLALSYSMCPQAVDDNLMGTISDTLNDKSGNNDSDSLQLLIELNEQEIASVFDDSCPPFITTSLPSFESDGSSAGDGTGKSASEASLLQKTIFLNEVVQRKDIPSVVSYLKMCTSIKTSKLANFLSKDGAETDSSALNVQIGSMLMKLKYKRQGLRWRGGSAGSGVWLKNTVAEPLPKSHHHTSSYHSYAHNNGVNSSGCHFTIDSDDMIHVSSKKNEASYHEYYLRQINKLVRLNDEMKHASVRE